MNPAPKPTLDGRFQALSLLGRGGMAEVWLAQDVELGQEVAVKLLAGDLAQDSAAEAALLAEHAHLVALAHPHVVGVKGAGRAQDGRPFYAMERLAEGPAAGQKVEAKQVLAWLGQALAALARLHAAGLVHGDVTPANLRPAADGGLRLLDLGLVRPSGQAAQAIAGTPRYLAPELARGEPVDARADLYGLACVAYEWLAGRPPFLGEVAADLVRAHLHAPPPAAPEGTPALLAGWLATNLAKAPSGRHPSALAARAALGLAAEGPPPLLSPGLVGRGQVVGEAVAALLGGESVVVEAEAGAGASVVLEATGAALALQGRRVLRVSGANSKEPLAALAQAAKALGLGPSGVAADPDDPNGRKRAGRWRAAVVAEGKVVWLIDQGGALDEASRGLLESLAPQAPQLWALHPEEKGPKEARRIVLATLDEAAIAEVGAKALGVPYLPPALARALHEVAKGQAWAALACLKALVEAGAMPHADGRWRPEACDPSALRPPTQPDAAWLQRLAQCQAATQALAEALSVAEAPAPLPVVAKVAGLGLVEAAQGQAELAAAGGLADGASALVLTPRLASALRSAMDESVARKWHRAWASAWREAGGQAAALAVHALAAGEGAQASSEVLAAAHALVLARAFGAAKRLAEALQALPQLPPATQGELWELQGDVARMLGDAALAGQHYQAALAADPQGPKARRLCSLAVVLQIQADTPAARAAAEAAILAGDAEGRPAEALRAAIRLARLCHAGGGIEEAIRLAESALGRAEALGAQGSQAELMGFLALMKQAEAPQEALAMAEAACAMQKALGDPVGELDAHNMRGNLLLSSGRHPEALEAFEEVGRLAAAMGGQGDEEALALVNQAAVLAELGRPAEALARAEAGMLTLEARQSAFLAAYARSLVGHLAISVGQLAEGLGQLKQAEASAKAQASGYLTKLVAVHLAEGRLEVGDRVGAMAAAQLGRSHASPGDEAYDRLLAVEARAAAALQALEVAPELAELVGGRLSLAPEGPEAPRLALAAAALAALGPEGQGLGPWGDASRPKQVAAAMKEAGKAGLASEAWALAARLAAQGGSLADAARLAASGQRTAAEAGYALAAAGLAIWWGQGQGGEDVATQAAAGARALEGMAKGLSPSQAAGLKAWWRLPAGGPAGPSHTGVSAEAASRVAAFGRLVTGSLELGTVLESALDEAMSMVDAERGMITLVEADGAQSGLVVRPKAAATDGGLMAFSSSLVKAALEEGRAIGLADAQADERFGAAASVMALDLRTVVCVPLMAGERAMGVLYLDRRSVNARFGPEDLALLEGLASFAALAINNAREHGAARTRLAMLEAFQALRGLDAPKADLGPALEATLVQAKRLAGASQATWWVVDPAQEGGWLPAGGDLSPPWGNPNEASLAASAGGPRGLGEGAWAPARSGGSLLGLLAVGGGRAGLPVPPDEVEALGALASATGRALGARLKARHAERREALRDGAMAHLSARRGRGMRDAASGLSLRDALQAWLQEPAAQEGALIAVALDPGAAPETWAQVGAALDELAPLGGRAARWGPGSALAWTPSVGASLEAVVGGLEDLLPEGARMGWAEGGQREGPAAWAERALEGTGEG